MSVEEVILDVKKTLKISIEGKDIREEIQLALSKINANFLILSICTGFGKSKIALNSVVGNNILIIHKQNAHKMSWEDEIVKWGFSYNVTYSTYNSLYKLEGQYFDTIIADEIHGGTTDIRLYSLQRIKWDKLICLSATIPDEKMKMLYSLGKPVIVNLPINKSIMWGITPIPKIKAISYFLNNTNRNQKYIKSNDKTRKDLIIPYQDRYKYFSDKNHNIIISCTEQEYHELLIQDIEYWKQRFFKEKLEYQKNKWLRLTLNRKIWLNHLKTNVAKQLISKLKNKRIIVFTTDIKQCEELGKNKEGIIHSKNNKSLSLIKEFNEGKINHLYSVNMIVESVNLVDLDCAVMVNLDASTILITQKLGRSFRSVEPEVYVIKIPYTRDSEFFDKMKEELDDSYFEYITIDKI